MLAGEPLTQAGPKKPPDKIYVVTADDIKGPSPAISLFNYGENHTT